MVTLATVNLWVVGFIVFVVDDRGRGLCYFLLLANFIIT